MPLEDSRFEIEVIQAAREKRGKNTQTRKVVVYDKLVRDHVVKYLEEKGLKVKWHYATAEELLSRHITKLKEETEEFEVDPGIGELVDLQELVFALADRRGISHDELEKARRVKAADRGGFTKGIILDEVEESN